MNAVEGQERKVIGLDVHPYLFSAAALSGADASTARTEWVVDRLPLERLEEVLRRRTEAGEVVVLEASGNSWAVAERLWNVGLKVVVLESQSVGRVGKAYCATDKVDAVKIARVYLSGLAHAVWIPDDRAAQRRELFFAHRNAVSDTTRARNRIWAYLNQHGVRRRPGVPLSSPTALESLRALRAWTPRQEQLLAQLVTAFQQAEARRKWLAEEIAAEVASDPDILPLIRLLGIRDKVAFALMAFIGTIDRFENPKKLVAYFGLNPWVSLSGISRGYRGLGPCGRADVRALLIQAAQSILRYGRGPTHRWALALKMRKGSHVAVAAVARKLVVSVWYLLKGFFTPLTDPSPTLRVKLHKIASQIGRRRLRQMGFPTATAFEQQKLKLLLQMT